MNDSCVFRVVLAMALSAIVAASGISAIAADGDHKAITIVDQGSFFVGGETKHRGPDDDITINQMYVQYQISKGSDYNVPVVMTHGCCLSSKTWETTPDGRMGWDEYFLRKHHPVYLAEQVSRARSGFDATPFNLVRAGELPRNSQPEILQASHQFAWQVFRFGPRFDEPFGNEQFPLKAVDELYKQMIPDINAGLPEPNPTWKALSDLAIELHGAVLIGHSESGAFPEAAALTDPSGIKGIISIEPGACDRNVFTEPRGYTRKQIKALARIPILVMFGDHLNDVEGDSIWPSAFNNCNAFVQKINNVGGNATMMHLPDFGLYGNSHMLMQTGII